MDFFESYDDFIESEVVIENFSFEKQQFESDNFSDIDCRNGAFEGMRFIRCNFSNSTFIDVKFVDCDFSNSSFDGAYFKNCEFITSKCVGLQMVENRILDCKISDSIFRYSAFDKSKINNLSARKTDFTETSFSEVSFKKIDTKECVIVKSNFFKTRLNGIDFSKDEFYSPIVSESFFELKGLKINQSQAVDLAVLLGVIID